MKFQSSIVINRPVEEVWAYVSDIDKMPLWNTSTIEARLTSDPPLRRGSTYLWVGQFLGRRIEAAAEVTEFEPNRAWGYKTTSGPITSAATTSLEPADGGTRVTMSAEGEVGGFFKLAEPVMANMTKRQFEGMLANLKDLLETAGAQPA